VYKAQGARKNQEMSILALSHAPCALSRECMDMENMGLLKNAYYIYRSCFIATYSEVLP
jgi:hypothetical protein